MMCPALANTRVMRPSRLCSLCVRWLHYDGPIYTTGPGQTAHQDQSCPRKAPNSRTYQKCQILYAASTMNERLELRLREEGRLHKAAIRGGPQRFLTSHEILGFRWSWMDFPGIICVDDLRTDVRDQGECLAETTMPCIFLPVRFTNSGECTP